MLRRFLLLGLLFATVPAFAGTASAPKRVVLPDTVVPSHYALTVTPDAAAKQFTGAVTISLSVKKPTQDVVLNAADLSFQDVRLSGQKNAPKVSFDDKTETATLHFAQPLKAGGYTLSIRYTGKINDSPNGLFALDYAAAGKTERALFTQFENSDARRFLPCWDEPGIKTSYTLTAVLPDTQMPVSNMPVASKKKLPHGLQQVTFQKSPKMSSYLLFYGQGDFERVARKVGTVEVGVIVKRGDLDKASFALNAAAEILPYYNDYFGTPYPLPKLDMIAGPGQSQFFGAMENWGAMFFFESALLVDDKVANEGEKRGRYITIAHEMAHQWFGDLVTMAWWDDLWLNEGFASWMEYKAADKLHPDWKAWLGATRSKDYALTSDARNGTHPIIQPIYDVLQASQAFDEITYSKGAAVIRMLEDYVGEAPFRDGVRAYMKKHAYGNTVTNDLWVELDKASGKPVSQVAHDFTLQPGVPLIHVDQNGSDIVLTQSRFAVDDSGKAVMHWHVPVSVADTKGTVLWRGLVADAPVKISVPAGTTAIVNAGQAGYFRTQYTPAHFAALSDRFAGLSAYDQLGVLGDRAALSSAGLVPAADVLQIVAKASPDMDPKVLTAIVGQVSRVAYLMRETPSKARAQLYGRRVLAPLLAQLGWDARPGEDSNVGMLRTQLLTALGGDIADPAVIAEARKRFAAYIADHNSLSADLRDVVFGIVASHATASDWEAFHTLARQTTDSMEKRDFYVYLGIGEDTGLVEKALALTLTDEIPVTVRPALVSAVSGDNSVMAFDFATTHMAQFDSLLEPSARNQFYVRLAMNAHDPAMFAKLDSFGQAHVPETARAILTKARAMITQSIKVRAETVPQIEAYLQKVQPE